MKKIIVFAFALTMAAAWPTSATAADNCGCATTDVTCVNNCTLSKVSALRKDLQTKKENAKAQVAKAKKANVNTNNAEAKAQAKAKVQSRSCL